MSTYDKLLGAIENDDVEGMLSMMKSGEAESVGKSALRLLCAFMANKMRSKACLDELKHAGVNTEFESFSQDHQSYMICMHVLLLAGYNSSSPMSDFAKSSVQEMEAITKPEIVRRVKNLISTIVLSPVKINVEQAQSPSIVSETASGLSPTSNTHTEEPESPAPSYRRSPRP